MRLEDRDRRVLAEVFLSRLARRDDLIALGYFNSVSRCNARLLELRREGLVGLRTQLDGAELRCPLYFCTSKGIRVAADDLGVPLDQALETHRPGMRELAIRHALRCTDLRIRIEHALANSDSAKLRRWSHELLCRHEFETSHGRPVLVKPDALCVVGHQGQDFYVFVEVDLGNASLPRFRDKLARYALYADSGAFADVYPVKTFRVLTVTTEERRLQNLVALSQRREFAFTTWRRMQSSSLIDPLLRTGKGGAR